MTLKDATTNQPTTKRPITKPQHTQREEQTRNTQHNANAAIQLSTTINYGDHKETVDESDYEGIDVTYAETPI